MKRYVIFLLTLILFGCEGNGNLYTNEQDQEKNNGYSDAYPSKEYAGVEIEENLANDFRIEKLTVVEYKNPNTTKSDNILTLEEAAEIGGRYIWDVLGISIDGKYLQLSYTSPCASIRSTWFGQVAETEQDLNGFQNMFSFAIDATTGERIDITNLYDIEPIRRDNKEVPHPEAEEIEIYMEIAKNYAKKHFNSEKIVNIEPHPKLPFNSMMGLLHFNVTDETGREAEIAIQLGSQRLFSISTQQNDFETNFNSGSGIG